MRNIPVISSWSGGKDSCLACYKAIQQGYQVNYLLNFASSETQRCCFHGIENEIMKMQADAIGISLIQKEVSNNMQDYEKEFKSAVNELKSCGIQGMVFGDIYLDEHKEWVDRVCNDMGIACIEPLWNQSTESIITEFIDAEFKAVIISAKSDLFREEFLGRLIDYDLVEELKRREICLCGENGEFHTFVVDGPIFKKEIRIIESQPLFIEGFWKHWSLDIKKVEINTKN